jgi:hypothetical protein
MIDVSSPTERLGLLPGLHAAYEAIGHQIEEIRIANGIPRTASMMPMGVGSTVVRQSMESVGLPAQGSKRPSLSAEARKKISDAQKLRWAAQKKKR